MQRYQTVFSTIGMVLFAAAAQAQPPAPQPPTVPVASLNLNNVSLTEVVNQLAQQLHINIVLDPGVKGGVTINTYGDTRNLDVRSLLDQILRINGFGMAQVGDLYRVVPLKDIAHQPLRPQTITDPNKIPEDDQIMLNLIFLKYVSVDELMKVLDEFAGENAILRSYAPANLLMVMDSRRNMRRLMELIAEFDSDTFANQRVRLFEVKNTKPSDLEKDLENVLGAISLDSGSTPTSQAKPGTPAHSGTVKFLPVDRINTLIAVAPNPGVFDTIAQWVKKLDVPVTITAGAVETHVYHLRYQRAECVAMALSQLFG